VLGHGRVVAMSLGQIDDALAALAGENIDVLRIDGASVVDRPSLMERFATDLGIPDDDRPSGWDGLSDRVRTVLVGLRAPRAVIVWSHAEQLVRHSMDDVLAAVVVFSDLARAVETTATGFPRPVRLQLVLAGEGPGFG
jgi:hypothetical protein